MVAEGLKYDASSLNIRFEPRQEVTVFLNVTPLETGTIKITAVEWTLFEKFKCVFDFAVPDKLRDSGKMFSYIVQEQSSELAAEVGLERDLAISAQQLIFNEACSGLLMLKPTTKKVKNVFLACSHPQLFGF